MTRARHGETTVGEALKGGVGHLMRQIRKYAALKGLLAALPPELADMAAPADLRLAAGDASGTGTERADGAVPELNTVFIYVASATVATVVTQRKRALIEAANHAAGLPLVEELRCELAPPAKIARQLNILGLKPD